MFVEAGYQAIGMDHFAKNQDELAIAYRKKRLRRNFQGYTVLNTENVLGFGLTAIGFVENSYIQNAKELPEYYQAIDAKILPTKRGKILSEDDIRRRFVIQNLMCNFEISKREFEKRFLVSFDAYFSEEKMRLQEF